MKLLLSTLLIALPAILSWNSGADAIPALAKDDQNGRRYNERSILPIEVPPIAIIEEGSNPFKGGITSSPAKPPSNIAEIAAPVVPVRDSHPVPPAQVQRPPTGPVVKGPPKAPASAAGKALSIDDNPGAGLGIGREKEPLTSEEYETKGRQQLETYKRLSKDPDVKLVNTVEELGRFGKDKAFLRYEKNKGYEVVADYKSRGSMREAAILRSIKNDDDTYKPFRFEDIGGLLREKIVNGRGQGPGEGRILSGLYDPRGQVVIYQQAFKAKNAKVANNIPLNELSMQLFLSSTGGSSKNLRAMVLADIQNVEFWSVVRSSYADMGKKDFSEQLTFARGTPQFDRFMGTPNVASKFFSLGNHHEELGTREPYAIIVRPKQVPTGEGQNGHLDAVILLRGEQDKAKEGKAQHKRKGPSPKL